MEPQLHDLEASLRSEVRLEAEEAEREAARCAAMRRTLRDVACDFMAHGDTVAVGMSQQRLFEGRIRHVGSDFLSIECRSSRVDVRLGAVVQIAVAERALAGGRGPSHHDAPGWRARLLELELGGHDVGVGLDAAAEERAGTIVLVGADHFCLADAAGGPPPFIPFSAVAYLRTEYPGPEDEDG